MLRFFLDYVTLFLLFLKDKRTEQNDVHYDEECNQNTQRQQRLFRGKRCQKHHRETKDDGGKILINKVIRNGCFEVGVKFSKQDDTRACRTRQHPVHRHKLFF